jgi:transposase InsO family protein
VSASEKLELIHLVEGSSLSVRRTLAEIGLPRSTFYAWYKRYLEGGPAALEDRKPRPRAVWNRIPDRMRENVIETALVHTELSPRELACRITDREGQGDQLGHIGARDHVAVAAGVRWARSPAYILLQAADRFQHPTRGRNELWQTDFTYLPVVGWGWYYLSTVLDDYSRKILAWKLGATMRVEDVTETLDLARAATGVDRVRVEHKPRLLSDNGPCYVAKDLALYLKEHGLGHTRGRPYHPMTQGKIERYHRSMKNVVRLENYYSPWELERALTRFVEYYNQERLHEAIGNVTPDDMYHGRQRAILSRREKIKRLTLERRKKENLRNAA